MRQAKTPKRLAALFVALMLLIGMVPMTVFAQSPITYLDENGESQTLSETYTPVTTSDTTWTDGWYVVDSNVTIDSRVTVNGNTKLILADSANLIVNGGIKVPKGKTFTIYGQQQGTGVLDARSTSYGNAGIGGNENEDCGRIIINGGTVRAAGGSSAAGIGGSGKGGMRPPEYTFMDGLIINGGTVEAVGGDGACGIGANCYPVVNIYGGVVNATGGKDAPGIGIAGWCSGGVLTIQGGIVTAYAGTSSSGDEIAGIGSNGTAFENVSLNTGVNGHAIIITSTINADGDRSTWEGVIIENNVGRVYGNSVTLDDDLNLTENVALTVPADSCLTIPDGITFTNNGTIYNYGTICVEPGGEYNGPKTTPNSVLFKRTPVSYLNYIGNSFVPDEIDVYTEITSENLPTTWTTGWYVVNSDVTINERIVVNGDVKLILCDNCTLNAASGISVTDDDNDFNNGSPNSLTIYGQSEGNGKLNAYSKTDGNSGIGGVYVNGNGQSTNCGTIIINGGVIDARTTGWAAAIGGGNNNGHGGTITINGGVVNAYVPRNIYNYADLPGGIGGGNNGNAGNITITGGVVTSTGSRNGIGGGGYATEGSINITGGVVTANGIGTYENTSYITTNISDNAVIICTGNGINRGNEDNWNGLIFENGDGIIYGSTVTPTDDFTIPNNYTLTLTNGQILAIDGITMTNDSEITIEEGVSIINDGMIVNNGKMRVNKGGTYSGAQPSGNAVMYQVDWDTDGDGTVDDTTYVAYDQTPSHTEGSKTGDAQYSYQFTEWNPTLAPVTGTATYTALFATSTNQYTVTLPQGQDGYTVTAQGNTTVDYGSTFTFTVNIKDDYSRTYAFAVKANNTQLQAEEDGSYTLTVTGDTTITVDGVEKIPTISVTGKTSQYLQRDTIVVNAAAGASDVASVEVQKDNSTWSDITSSYGDGYPVTENGTYTFRAISGAGVVGAEQSITYTNIDSVKPVVAIDSGSYVSDTWSKDHVTLSVSNTAANSGTTTFQYKVDDGDWQTYTDSITISEETAGTTYTFKAVSASGVESDQASITVKLDKTAPDGDIKIQENSVKQLLNQITFGLFFNKNVDVDITGTDALSGVASIQFYRSQDILTQEEVEDISDWQDYTSITETAVDAEKFVYYARITDQAGNATIVGSDGVVFDLTAPAITGVTNGGTYYTTQSVTVADANLATVTVNGVADHETLTLGGNVDQTYTIVATDKAGNSTTLTVTMKPIASLAHPIKGITADTVTSKDQAAIESVKADTEAVNTEYATDEEKAELKEILDTCNALLAKIEESAQAGNTENTDKVEDITADNVKPEDKDDLISAKEDLEDALDNFGDNYTQEEKQALENKLDQINQALESIEKVESVQDAISALPDTVEPDDTDVEAIIDAVKEQYEALTDHEKSLVGEALKEKLEHLLAALGDYRMTQGQNAQWTQGTQTGLTFTVNGAFTKFIGIEVDGKVVDKAHYTAVSGSTIITLKPEYLETLSVGQHTLTVLFTDAKVDGQFEILAKPQLSTPDTGDNSQVTIWITLLFAAVCGLTGTMVYTRKKKHSK